MWVKWYNERDEGQCFEKGHGGKKCLRGSLTRPAREGKKCVLSSPKECLLGRVPAEEGLWKRDLKRYSSTAC